MKSFEQIAQSAYLAHAKELHRRVGVNVLTWSQLPANERECWIAAAKQLWAEFAAIH